MSKQYIPEPLDGLPQRGVNLIVIHCSATKSGEPLKRSVIDGWHRTRNFRARSPIARAVYNPELTHFGYHFFLGVDGVVYTGRHVDEIGQHAKDFNAASIGICMAGGVEKQGRYSPKQWASLAALVQELAEHYNIPLQAPVRQYRSADSYTEHNGICGHRDLSPDGNGNGRIESYEWLKTCPGFDVSHWLKNGLYPATENILEV
jgi:N-acetylmuramoyl-L-alanine amidase